MYDITLVTGRAIYSVHKQQRTRRIEGDRALYYMILSLERCYTYTIIMITYNNISFITAILL